ncbi:hypothetical protein ACIRPK_06670 [Kitasatospora sp. NPDC101801]|uniref:hypothetical protein n=1 Tax=Kitasatospora sp. NPDC101801 TaxID=3364103 RepID=UPI00382F0D27
MSGSVLRRLRDQLPLPSALLAGGRDRDAAPWVRTRLRTAPLAALLTAALALTVVFLAAALPRALDRGANDALHTYLRTLGPIPTSVRVTSGPAPSGDPAEMLDTTRAQLTGAVGAVLPLAPSGPVYGRQGVRSRSLENPGLDRPDGISPHLTLLYQHRAREHVGLTAGQWPGAAAPGEPIPVAVSVGAGKTIGVRLGQVLDGGDGQQARVVGLYTADDPSDPFWAGQECATKVCRGVTDSREIFWTATALVGPEVLSRLAGWGNGDEDFWRLPVDVGVLRADQLRQTSFALASVTAGPIGARMITDSGRPKTRITSRLRSEIDSARKRQSAIDSLAGVGPAGAAGVAAVLLCLAAALTAERRTAELRLLRARGAGTGGICRRLLGEGALTVLPAAGLGALLAFTLLPTPRWPAAAVAAGSVALLALLAFPVRTALLLRETGRTRSGRPRLMGELAVLAATVAAATQVVRRGVAPLGEGVDPLLVAAPLLMALTGALLLARLQPVLIGLLARRARPRPGAIAFLGLARAARGSGPRSRPSVLPLLALVLAVTCGAVGSTVLSSVSANRMVAARYTIGGDALISTVVPGALPEALVAAAERLPGVRTSVPVWVENEAKLWSTSDNPIRIRVVMADPVEYAKLAEVAGRGRFDPTLLSAVPGSPLPALVTSDLSPGEYRIQLDNGGEPAVIRAVGSADGTPALFGAAGSAVVLPAGPGTAALPRLVGPNRWLATGAVDDARLRALAEEFLGQPAVGEETRHLVRTSAGTVTGLGSDPLQNSAERLFWVTVGATALFALLCVLLTLYRAGPERAAMLARLRTMGLRPRQGLALILAEALPQALFAALGGALTAVGCILLLGPAVDLSPLVGAEVPTGLRLTAAPILEQTLGLALLASLAVLAEAAVTARRQITTELRAGDTR